MARGILFPAGLTVLTVAVLLYQICSAEDCPPSSCGNIRNISYPFRLEGDPKNCGHPNYTLSCENNQTVLYLYAGKYYVRHIGYDNQTIRVVDPGILNNNDSFIPRYSLDTTNFSSGDPFRTSQYPYQTRRFPYETSWYPCEGSRYPYQASWNPYQASRYPYQRGGESDGMVFVKCEKPVNSSYHLNISPCFEDGVHSSNSSLSHSKKHTYFLLSNEIGYVEDLCRVAQVSVSPWLWEASDDLRNNISCTAVRNKLLFGFELSWYRAYCERCRRNDYCYLDEKNNVTCHEKGAYNNAYEKKRHKVHSQFLVSFFLILQFLI